MSFVKYQNTNNASSLLIADITASQTTILITDWDQWLFPSSFPFLLTIEHLDASENVILREIVKVVSSNQNSFTVERSAWICVQDDTATNRVQDNTAHAFYSWDKISLYWTAEQVQDIQNNLEQKANQEAIANLYDNTATYSVWDIVVYGWDRYVCSTAVETAEEFDSTKWTKINVQYTLDNQQSQIDNIETEIQNLWWTKVVDILVLGWWGWWGWGWRWNNGSWYMATWWWGWAWQLKVIDWYVVRDNCYTVSIWWGWAWWWLGCVWANWWNSSFWKLISIWWWWGWGAWRSWATSHCWFWCDWWNGWGAWWSTDNLLNSCVIAWSWVNWWHSWWVNNLWGCAFNTSTALVWWWWGWVWWNWWNWITSSCQRWPQWGHVWWKWIHTCFWWTLLCIWWWWTTSTRRWNTYIFMICWTWYCCLKSYDNTYWWHHYWWWIWSNMIPCNATANTWWGWWGWFCCKAWWNGWSWLVIVRYPTDCSYWIKTATWGTITTATIDWIEYKVHTFTSDWTFEITESV